MYDNGKLRQVATSVGYGFGVGVLAIATTCNLDPFGQLIQIGGVSLITYNYFKSQKEHETDIACSSHNKSTVGFVAGAAAAFTAAVLGAKTLQRTDFDVIHTQIPDITAPASQRSEVDEEQFRIGDCKYTLVYC